MLQGICRKPSWRWMIRRFSSVASRICGLVDEGDWAYSSEWWGTDSDGHAVFQADSLKGNGSVSVVAYPSSRPDAAHWPAVEAWLQERYAKIHPESEHNGQFRILGYQWRVLRFNEITRQSAVKIMAAYRKSDPGTVYYMQQPHFLAIPYLKSMVCAGFASIASCNYDLLSAVSGKKVMKVLCIGHGGGSLPLFLASKIQGAIIHIVEIDPVVITASIQSMGFPASVMKKMAADSSSQLNTVDEVLWKGVHERLFLYEADAENFILEHNDIYDLIFIDAYDGDDIFPHKLWDRRGRFLRALRRRLHPQHGTVVVNLHGVSDILNSDESISSFLNQNILKEGKYISKVCRSFKDVLLGEIGYGKQEENAGLAFVVSVPWLCNVSLVVSRGSCLQRDSAVGVLASKSHLVEDYLSLPFSCIQYIKRGFVLVD